MHIYVELEVEGNGILWV